MLIQIGKCGNSLAVRIPVLSHHPDEGVDLRHAICSPCSEKFASEYRGPDRREPGRIRPVLRGSKWIENQKCLAQMGVLPCVLFTCSCC